MRFIASLWLEVATFNGVLDPGLADKVSLLPVRALTRPQPSHSREISGRGREEGGEKRGGACTLRPPVEPLRGGSAEREAVCMESKGVYMILIEGSRLKHGSLFFVGHPHHFSLCRITFGAMETLHKMMLLYKEFGYLK